MGKLVKIGSDGRESGDSAIQDRSGVADTVGGRPSAAQVAYLRLGLDQPGGKLPLFDRNGQEINRRTIRACISNGWAEQWFKNPIKPQWLVCRLTDAGIAAIGGNRS
jgi:hypothetical protein